MHLFHAFYILQNVDVLYRMTTILYNNADKMGKDDIEEMQFKKIIGKRRRRILQSCGFRGSLKIIFTNSIKTKEVTS